jgi:hypothetical protein
VVETRRVLTRVTMVEEQAVSSPPSSLWSCCCVSVRSRCTFVVPGHKVRLLAVAERQ